MINNIKLLKTKSFGYKCVVGNPSSIQPLQFVKVVDIPSENNNGLIYVSIIDATTPLNEILGFSIDNFNAGVGKYVSILENGYIKLDNTNNDYFPIASTIAEGDLLYISKTDFKLTNDINDSISKVIVGKVLDVYPSKDYYTISIMTNYTNGKSIQYNDDKSVTDVIKELLYEAPSISIALSSLVTTNPSLANGNYICINNDLTQLQLNYGIIENGETSVLTSILSNTLGSGISYNHNTGNWSQLDNTINLTAIVTPLQFYYELNVEDELLNIHTKRAYVNYVYPILFGNSIDNDPSSDDINTQTVFNGLNKLLENSSGIKNISFNFNSEYAYFAYDNSYADLTKIEDNNGFDVTGLFTKHVVNCNINGVNRDYKIYVSNNLTSISNTYKFIF